MSLKILKQTLMDRWKSIGLVTGLIFVFMAYYTTVYPATAALDMSQSLGDLLDSPAIKLLLGDLQINNSFESFLSIKALVFIAWIATGFMAWLAAAFLSGEIDHKTIDLLLAQPVQRGRLVVARYIALALTAALVVAGALIGTVLSVKAMNIATSVPWLACAMGYMAVLTAAFAAIALFVSACMSDNRKAVLISLGLMIVMYFMETVGSVVDLLGPIRYLSIFHYARYNEILMTHNASLLDLAVLVVIAAVFVGLSVYVFRRRDIHVA